AEQRTTVLDEQGGGDRGIDGAHDEGDGVGPTKLGNLDQGELTVLRVAQLAPGKSTEERGAEPLTGDPQDGRGQAGPTGAAAAGDQGHRRRNETEVESAIARERHGRRPRQRPRDVAVRAKREVQPPK